ncbi:MAG: hypothetical protein NUV64_01620 [Parcubacteria group bacterium]|nr:hypothetical protein [Parcubacteria group bacterium]MCR4342742.1 hypothetical protein [Patescibacteria group bacterium]
MKNIIFAFAVGLLLVLEGCAEIKTPEEYNPPETPYKDWYYGDKWMGYYKCSPYPTCPNAYLYLWITPPEPKMTEEKRRSKYKMGRDIHKWGLFTKDPPSEEREFKD